MLYPRLTNCTDCTTITSLIEDIDCKLAKLGTILYNNLVYMLNKSISTETYISLLFYRRILQYKSANPDYASDYTLDEIANKVKLLKYK